MALFSNKRNIKLAKEAAGQVQSASIRGMEIADTEKARSIAAEETKFSVLTALGTEGTYGPGATGTGGGGGGSIFNTSGTGLSAKDSSLTTFGNHADLTAMGIRREGWQYSPEEEAMLQERGTRQGILDPEAYTRELSKSPLFQMQSFQVAEAKQLLEREGPLWERLENSTLGAIYEGAALQLRDTTRRLRNAYAKGGTARNAALNEFNQILAAERSMQMRVNETWKANLDLNDYVQKNFERVRNGSMKFVDALPGLNDSYRTAMLSTARLAVEATATAGVMAGQAYDIRMSQQAVNFGTKLVEGLIQAVASAIPVVGPVLGSAISYAGASGGGGTPAAGDSGVFSGLFGGVGGAIAEGLTGIMGGPQTSVSSTSYGPSSRHQGVKG